MNSLTTIPMPTLSKLIKNTDIELNKIEENLSFYKPVVGSLSGMKITVLKSNTENEDLTKSRVENINKIIYSIEYLRKEFISSSKDYKTVDNEDELAGLLLLKKFTQLDSTAKDYLLDHTQKLFNQQKVHVSNYN